MRPCQQCGAAIQMREAVCSACGHEQTATIGVNTNRQVTGQQVSPSDPEPVVSSQKSLENADAVAFNGFILLLVMLFVITVLCGFGVAGPSGAMIAVGLIVVGVVIVYGIAGF